MELVLEKDYYSIGETAKMFNVNTSLLRFWESQFDVIKPYKNKKGDRYFSKKDIMFIQKIYHLTKEKGYTLNGAKAALKQKDAGENWQEQVLPKLENIKERLINIYNNL
ncbi:MAG: MerR family transcriptional regulator [Bacteroidales bacterium]|nr:MerR family transcriptional regulator [Bacteroidales bacterium]